VSSGSTDWVLFNASPDLLSQFRAFPELQPARSVRDTAVRSIVLMDAQIDHTTGLLMLREGQPLEIYSTEMAREDLTTGNPLFSILTLLRRKLAPGSGVRRNLLHGDWRRRPGIHRSTGIQ